MERVCTPSNLTQSVAMEDDPSKNGVTIKNLRSGECTTMSVSDPSQTGGYWWVHCEENDSHCRTTESLLKTVFLQ